MANRDKKMTALRDTVIKKSWKDSSEPGVQVKDCPKGTYFYVKEWAIAPNDHLKVLLDYDAGTWYIYDPHWYFPPTDGMKQAAYPTYTSADKKLSDKDFIEAARYLNVPIASLKAVLDVEVNYFNSNGGFLASGKPKILFEAHWFHEFTDGIYSMSHPDISSRRWNRDLYVGGEGEWDRFKKAYALNAPAAIKSTSWGVGQVMGFHWKLCGFSSPKAYYDAQFVNEYEQLKCMMKFLEVKGLTKHMRSKNWAAFAYTYNGKSYAVNKYDVKLGKAYNFYS